ncbi:ATP-binding cassette domain-containing protein [Edwardsiella ictaluri]|uniref:ATP-binding cassette domain-containing protein n=1 Tax=Edwardsiella ictaluri TaxID=67780 RepID=UPI003784B0F0
MTQPALELIGLNKWFGPVHALRDIHFQLFPGEVVALLGDNGAGKSTLIRAIAGAERFDSGTLKVAGQALDGRHYNVLGARRQGIETVYQNGALGLGQSLWRNLFLGRHLRNRWGFIDERAERLRAQALLRQLNFRGVGANVDALVGQLSGGERQGLAIGRAMLFDARLVILDEPTTALSLGEVEKVLCFIEQLRVQGRACLLITHNMADAYRVADRFVVMDRGAIVTAYRKDQLTLASLQQALLDAVRS